MRLFGRSGYLEYGKMQVENQKVVKGGYLRC